MSAAIRAAWEWRAFRGVEAEDGSELLELAAPLARQLGVGLPDDVDAEDDTYLVIPGVRHNLKLRGGALQVKVQIARLSGGFSLWQDKQVMTFPFDAQQVARLWALLPRRRSSTPGAVDSPGTLMRALRQEEPRLAVVGVAKRRLRMNDGRARLEVASLQLPGGLRFLSFCADGYDLRAVREVVRRGGLRPGARILGYVDLLQEAVWWFPSLTGGADLATVLAAKGKCTGPQPAA